MKKLLLNLALIASVSFAMTACDLLGGDDDETGGDPSSYSTGTMTAKVDGSTWESKPTFGIASSFATVSGELLSITGSAVSGTNVKSINITVYGYQGEGTYTFGVNAENDYALGSYFETAAGASQITYHLSGYDETGDNSVGNGEIIITKEEEVDGKKVLTGTFKFTTGKSYTQSSSGGTQTEIDNAAIEVTNGAFKLTSAF